MTLTALINEEKYGMKARSANELMNKITSLDWYSNIFLFNSEVETKVAHFMDAIGVDTYEVKWVSRENLEEIIGKLSFEGSFFGDVLKEYPSRLKQEISSNGNEQLLADIIEKMPELVFHSAFEKAFNCSEKSNVVSFLVGHSIYISILACTAELIDTNNRFVHLLDIIESGHVLLGPIGNTLYLL